MDIWGPMAERVAEQVPKGSNICVQGKLNPSSWVNREGVKQTKWKVLHMHICYATMLTRGIYAVCFVCEMAAQHMWQALQLYCLQYRMLDCLGCQFRPVPGSLLHDTLHGCILQHHHEA